MGLYKRKGSPYFWIKIKLNNGIWDYESTKTTNKKLAEKIHAKRVTEITEGKWFPSEAKKRTFDELRTRYMSDHSKINKTEKSIKRDESLFDHLSLFFGGLTIFEITPAKISDYRSNRIKEKAKPGTIQKELSLLRHALNMGRQWEWIETSPFTRVKLDHVYDKVERWITPKEEKKLLEASPSWLQEIILFALNTGLRQGEILSLQWPEVDLFRKTATLLVTKNKEKRTIPLNQTVLDLLKSKNKVRFISGYVFASKMGTQLNPRNLLRAFFIARKKAGLEDVRFHDLRHTFATRLVQAKIDLYVVKELLGHKTINMTMRYAHHNPESLRYGVNVLDQGGYNLVTIEENNSGLNAVSH